MAERRPDLRAGPPPRFRVVERDRRLVVVDAAGDAASTPASRAAGPPSTLGWLPRQVSFDGSAALTTLGWYDANGPRTIRLDPGAARAVRVAAGVALAVLAGLAVALFAEPLLIVPAGIVLAKARAGVRSQVTRWLDTVSREAG